MGLIPGVLTYVAYKTEVCIGSFCWDCDCCPRSMREHTLTTCRANMNSVASAGVTPSKSGKQLAINRKLELLFLFKSAPRTVPRPEVIWRGRQELGILYRFCRLVSVQVSAPWAVYSITSIYRMDSFCFVDFWCLVRGIQAASDGSNELHGTRDPEVQSRCVTTGARPIDLQLNVYVAVTCRELCGLLVQNWQIVTKVPFVLYCLFVHFTWVFIALG
jgi:hypothetical protein